MMGPMSQMFANSWSVCFALPCIIACSVPPAAPPKPKESRAQVLSTRTVRSDVEPSAVKTIAQRLEPDKVKLLEQGEGTVVGTQHADNASFLRVRATDVGPLGAYDEVLGDAECMPSIRCQVAVAVAPTRAQATRSPKTDGAGHRRASKSPAVARSQARVPELVIRLTDPHDAARLESVTLHSYRPQRAGVERRIRISGIDRAPKDANIQQDFAASWAEYIRRYAADEPFAAFAAARIQQWSVAAGRSVGVSDVRQRQRTDLAELMDFYTGKAEINNTLQTHRGLGTSASSLPKTISIGSIQGVEHEPRDYGALLAGAVGVHEYAAHPLADSVPNDALVVEFASVRDLVSLPQRIDQRLGLILAALEGYPGNSRLLERYRDQLILEQTSLAEKLGHVAIGSVALVIGDPYLREGSDVSLVFEVKERQLLEATLAGFVANARRVHVELETKSLTLAETPVVLHETPDGRLRRYQAWVGSKLLLSNSRRAITELLVLQRDKSRSLAQTPDYHWARSETPFSAESERALVFFGDAFVDKITGPRSKILEARRVRALAELRSVEYAALLFGWMQGIPPKDQQELLASGWLKRSDLIHFDGSPIRFDPRVGASSRFGTSEQLVPIVDLEMDKIDKEEEQAYAQFRANYERGLRGALDPTTLRFLRTSGEDQWRTELRILPLSPWGAIGTEFRQIVRHAGRGAVEPGNNPDGLRLALGLSRESRLRDMADDALHGVIADKQLTLGFLGDWVQIGLADDPWLWNMAVAERALPDLDGSAKKHEEFGLERNLDRLPLWAAVQIKSPLLLTAALATLRAQSHERLGDWVKWHDGDKYRDFAVTRVQVRPGGDASSSLAIHFAVVKDVAILSLDRRLLERRIDEVLANLRPKTADPAAASSQLVATFEHGSTHHLTNILGALLDAAAMRAHPRACVGLSLLAAGYGEVMANGAERSRLGIRVLGYAPESPAGPGLTINDGQCQHPIYGTLLEPKLPDGRDATSPLHAAARSLASMSFGLAVIPRAKELELIGRTEIVWK